MKVLASFDAVRTIPLLDRPPNRLLKKWYTPPTRNRSMSLNCKVVAGDDPDQTGWLLIGIRVVDPGVNPRWEIHGGDMKSEAALQWVYNRGEKLFWQRLDQIKRSGGLAIPSKALQRFTGPEGVFERLAHGSALNETERHLVEEVDRLTSRNASLVEGQLDRGKSLSSVDAWLKGEQIGGLDIAKNFATAVFSFQGVPDPAGTVPTATSVRLTNHHGFYSTLTLRSELDREDVVAAFQNIMGGRVVTPAS
jgi:hypothetical protein